MPNLLRRDVVVSLVPAEGAAVFEHLRRESGALRHENAQSPAPGSASLLPRYHWHHYGVGKMNRGTCTPMIVLIIATMISLSALGMLAACANE
jgi:hypothetical protein